ncbi:MAG TPA: tetratricopeptide repeat protein [Thermoplasmata archaeon]|nr:tetratricopeptide repeat protein [Thermoplasmata archaeon]
MSKRFEVGVQHIRAREYAPAADEFFEIVRETPSDAAAWSYYGIALAHLGRAADAEAALSRAISLSPRNEDAWFHLGIARSMRDEWAEAATAYQRAVALAPNDLVAWHRLGVALAESGDEGAASVAFERALVLSREVGPGPDLQNPVTPHRLDDHVEESGEREGAREAKSWLDLALSLLSLGDEEEAVAAYERAYNLDPDRAQRSLFHPMLRLLTAVEGADETLEGAGPNRPERPTGIRPPEPRPEVS